MKAKKLKLSNTKLKPVFPHFFISSFLSLVIYVLVVLVLLVSGQSVFSVSKKQQSKTIVEGVLLPQVNISPSEIFNVDPLLSSTDSDSVIDIRKNISFLIFSTLFKESVTGQMEKDIVQDYEFKNGKDLKIKIFENIYWHDGEKLTAKDIVFTLDVIKFVGQQTTYYGAVNGGDIEYKTLNDYEVQINLKGPNVAYLQELVFPILPQHKLQNYQKLQLNLLVNSNFGKSPIGSGKLKYSENSGSELELISNTNYYGKKISFDKYKFRFYKSYDALTKDYILKNIDLVSRKEAYEQEEFGRRLKETGAKEYTLKLKDRMMLLYLNSDPKSNNAKFSPQISLRHALMKVIDRKSLVTAISGYGREIYGPIDQTSWAFDSDIIAAQKLDTEGFIKTIESKGYTKKGDFYQKADSKLGFTLTLLQSPMRVKIAEQIKSDLKKVGVEVTLNIVGDINNTQQQQSSVSGVDRFNNIVNNRDFDILLTTVNQYQDPDTYSLWHSSKILPPGLNLSGLNSKVIDVSLVEGRIEPDQEKRKAKYIRFQKNFIEEVPAIYLLNPSIISYYSPRISNIQMDIVNNTEYKYQNISEWEVK